MRTIIAPLLSVGLGVVFAGPTDAASKKRHYYSSPYNSYA
jgi:hypothetical protein